MIDWSKFNHEEGEAWGMGAARLLPGEYNVRIAKCDTETKPGVLLVTFESEAPEEDAGRTIVERYTLNANAAGSSEKAQEVSLNRLRGMLRACKAPKNAPPSKWIGLRLAIEVRPQRNDARYTEIGRYGTTMPTPMGRAAGAVDEAETGTGAAAKDDGIPF